MRSLLILIAALAAAPALAASPIETRSGPIADVGSGNVRAFLGIPYAAPPVGALRWKAPQPVTPWTEPREAMTFGAACPQPDDRAYGLTPPVQSEDCLTLNVWAPARAAAPLPVMVWIHGGANRMGAGSLAIYEGAGLAGRGVVVVTLNYRLGYLGFFAHDALSGEGGGGNFALMDQIAALTWVRDNIAAFGGDPSRVTVFGESAGGGDILYLMSAPAAAGLFQGAIVQSGGGWHRPQPRARAAKLAATRLAKVGLEGAGAEALRQAPPAKFIEALVGAGMGFGPFIDGELVTGAPSAAFEAGRQARVPLIIGSNDWEASLIRAVDLGFVARAISWLPGVLGWYRDADDSQSRQERLFRDAAFGAPARWVAAQHSKHAPAFLYQYRHVRHGRKGQVPGAGHAAEIAFVFDTLDASTKTFAAASNADRALSTQLADCWAAFAREGRPACAAADWPAYTPDSDAVLWITDDVKVLKHPEGPVLDKVRDWFGPGALLAF